MTKRYQLKLVALAKEIIELNKPIITTEARADLDHQINRDNFVSKLNYLLGYITALEELNEK